MYQKKREQQCCDASCVLLHCSAAAASESAWRMASLHTQVHTQCPILSTEEAQLK